MSSAPSAKKIKKSNSSTIKFQGQKVEVSTFLINGIKCAIVHLPSIGITLKYVCDLWMSVLKTNGVMFASIDTNITYQKSGKITPFDIAQKVSEVCKGDGIIVSLMKFVKDRAFNIFRNPQFMKAKLPGQDPSEPDTDGMVYMINKDIIGSIDFIKTNNEIAKGNCSPFCYGNSGGVINYGSEVTKVIFDKSPNMFTDHSFLKILLTNGITLGFGSGAEMFGIGVKTMKDYVSELYGTPLKCQKMNKISDFYIKQMFKLNNRLFKEFGKIIGKDIPDFKITTADQKRIKKLNMSGKCDGDFNLAEKNTIVSTSRYKELCDEYIRYLIHLQEEVIEEIYSDAPGIKKDILRNLHENFHIDMERYFFDEYRWDKCWGYNLTGAQTTAGYIVPTGSPYTTKKKFSMEILKRIPEQGVFMLCECQGNEYIPYLQDYGIFCYTVMSEKCDEGTTYFSRQDFGTLTGGL